MFLRRVIRVSDTRLTRERQDALRRRSDCAKRWSVRTWVTALLPLLQQGLEFICKLIRFLCSEIIRGERELILFSSFSYRVLGPASTTGAVSTTGMHEVRE